MSPMRASLVFLARHRWAAVGLALLAEITLLVGLALAPPSAVVGIPAAVAAAIAGTVAVVFGVADGVAVAFAGALAFAALGGWGTGELAALAVWPGIVAAVGLFAHRVERHRITLRRLVTAQEQERRSLAQTLHDENAQTLAGALLTLRAGAHHSDAAAAAATEQARTMINQTIQALRELAVELSPKALEDYGLATALARLAETASQRSTTDVHFDADWDGRLPDEAERALFRLVQAALDAGVEHGADTVAIVLTIERGRIVLTVSEHGEFTAPEGPAVHIESAGERLRLLGGKLTVRRSPRGEVVLRAELPAMPRKLEGVSRVA